MKRNQILLTPDAVPATGGGLTGSGTLPPPLNADTGADKIAELKTALAAAEAAAQVLLADPHFRQCPFVAGIRGAATAGVERIEHLADWVQNNPAPAALAPSPVPAGNGAPIPASPAPQTETIAEAAAQEATAAAEIKKEIGADPDKFD